MSRILLLAHGRKTVPRGLFDIAAFLRQHGESVRVLHLYDKPARLHRIKRAPEIIGISTYTPIASLTERLIWQLRLKWPKALIIVGGWHMVDDVFDAEWERWHALADHVVVGEGEHAMLAIATGQSLSWIVRGQPLTEEEYRRLPLPSEQDIRDLFATCRSAVLFSRGCPYRCVFCSAKRAKIIRRSPEDAVTYLGRVQKWLGDTIWIQDDVFTVQREWLQRFVEERERCKAKWRLRVFIHGSNFDEDIHELLLRAGVRHATLGAESGNDGILKGLNKRTTVAQYLDIDRACRGRKGMALHALWMLGNLGDTDATVKQTLHYARLIGQKRPNFGFSIPYPGTEFYRLAPTAGRIIESDYRLWQNDRVVFVPEGMTRQALLAYMDQAKGIRK